MHLIVEAFKNNKEALEKFKKVNISLIDSIITQNQKKLTSDSSLSKDNINAIAYNQSDLILKKNELIYKNESNIAKLMDKLDDYKEQQIYLWETIMAIKNQEVDINEFSDPEDFGSSIEKREERYDVELLKSLLKAAGISDQTNSFYKFISNKSMDRQYKVGDYNSRDYYTITFRIDDVRWAYILKRIAKSKGLKKNITEFVFEHINYKKMQDSIYTDMKQNIDEIKNEKFFEINIQDILIEMLTTLKKTPNFHIKSLTIKGDDDLGEIGGIDNESFKILLDGLVSSRLCILSLWGMDIDQDKSNIIGDALSKRKAGKSKKVAEFEIKITKCNIKDNFGFISNIADGTQTINSICITYCGLMNDLIVMLIKIK